MNDNFVWKRLIYCVELDIPFEITKPGSRLSRFKRRHRPYVVRNVAGSNPGIYPIIFIRTAYLVLHRLALYSVCWSLFSLICPSPRANNECKGLLKKPKLVSSSWSTALRATLLTGMWDIDEISGLKKLGWFPAEVLFDPRSGLLMTNDSSPRLQMYPDSANVPLLFTHKGHASWTPHNSTRLWIDTGVDIVLSVLRPSYSGLLSQDRSKYLPRLRV